uniref:Interferon-induced protein 35 n=1 Tax=Neogobius melanostomus TaxID=47308 RepID=A0A8C6WK53_9GOBI
MSSSEEDFSLVLEPSEETLDGLKALIKNEKEKFDQLTQEQDELQTSLAETQGLTKQFRERTVSLQQDLEEDEERARAQAVQDQEQLSLLQQEEVELKQELERVLMELREEDTTAERLRQQADVFSGAPERPLVFRGQTAKDQDRPRFSMEPLIEYPLEGGSALITFEDVAVAQQVLTKRRHTVNLSEEFHMTVEARAVPLTLPTSVQLAAEVCPRRILVSDLPQMDRQTLEDKLDIHFSKSRHGGGEVESCSVLPESGHAVISFLQDDVAKGLTDAEYHDVKLTEGTHRVRATPFVNGRITELETRTKLCQRTVRLVGIPDLADMETMQDLLEIHFQKRASGGGEIEAVLYCPEGRTRTALFQTPRKDASE